MDKKRKTKNAKGKNGQSANSIEIGGNVNGSNVVAGNGNEITQNYYQTISPEKLALQKLHQLPPAPADFTGREEQLTQILDALVKHKGAAITGLTGMGGVGKTALGLVAAHQIQNQYPDAQIFLDLKGFTNPLSPSDALRHVILSFEPTADLREASEEQLAAFYQSLLADKKVLVFMDNARDAAQVRLLIPPETCALIVTSRTRFALPNMDPLRLDVLPEEKAVELLLEICKRTGEMAKEISELCGRLPLALRIAATFLVEHNDWSPKDYADRLKVKGLKLLKGDDDDARFNLEIVLSQSYEQLTEAEQKTWRALAVFPASFTREAAGTVWQLDVDAARDLLSKFQRMSLLDYDEKVGRYSLHDLLVEFARTKLNEEESNQILVHYALRYLTVLSNANDLYIQGGENVLKGLQLLDSEWTHILTAQNWSEANSNELCNEFPNAGYLVLGLRLRPLEHISWLESGLSAAKNLGNKKYQGYHLGNLGVSYKNLGYVRRAIKLYEEELSIVHEIGDRQSEGATFGNLGNVYLSLGDFPKSIELFQQALNIAQEIKDRRSEGSALANLGAAYLGLADLQKAIEFYDQSLIIVREIGNLRCECAILCGLGVAHKDSGDISLAIQYHEQSVAIAHNIGDRQSEAVNNGNLGSSYLVLGEVSKAIKFYEAQLDIAQEIGDRDNEGKALWGLGLCRNSRSETKDARVLFTKALNIFRAIESPSSTKIQKLLDDLDK